MAKPKHAQDGISRRGWLGAAPLVAALMAEASATPAGAAPVAEPPPDVYKNIGAKPFINCTATLTINGGSRQLPEVIEAIEHAGHYHVDLDQLQEAAGKRISELLKVPWAVVSSGAAGALAYAAAGCVAGTDPERMQQLPNLTGLKSEVIMPKSSRNAYDHSVRMVGLKTVEVDSVEELKAKIGPNTALIMVLGNRFDNVRVGLKDVAPIAKEHGIPVLVDAAADILIVPNPYLAAGADMVAYSGGKIIRGPQTAGMLVGREDLVRAAFANAAPHHAFGRPMKVSKEEIVGMVTAVDVWVNKRDIDAEYREWKQWYSYINDRISKAPGVTTKIDEGSRGGPFPTMDVSWDSEKVGLTGGELHEILMSGDPAIQTHATGDGHSFRIRPVAMKPDEYKIVADRLYEVFKNAPKPQKKEWAKPSDDVSGRWDVHVKFYRGEAEHLLFLQASGNRITGTHVGSITRGPLEGTIDGNEVKFSSVLPIEGSKLGYAFSGKLSGNRIEGKLDLGEYPGATWTAIRHSYGGDMPSDPAVRRKTG